MTVKSEPFGNLQMGKVVLPNRLIMAPVKTAYGTPDGMVNARHLEFYLRRAEGGVGSIIVEPFYIDKKGKEHPKQLGITSDEHLDGMKKLTATIHTGGAMAIAHLNHGGRAANPKASGSTPEAPSDVPCPTTGVHPEVLTTARIKELCQNFASAAQRAVQAGFDVIELQFGHGYLVSQFMSPATNLRTDEYGGNWDNRMRFGKEVLAAVRDAVGYQFPVMARISATLTGEEKDFAEGMMLAKWSEVAGVDALHVASGSACDSPPWYFQHMRLPQGKNLQWAAQIKREVSIPVIVAGRMGDPALIRKVLADGDVDGIALGRPLLADPDLPNKMKSSMDDEVAQCGACMQGCLARARSGEGLSCLLHPETGQLAQEIARSETSSKVVIIGGGPAGMQAALTAHQRGHQVVLYDEEQLGGRFNLAIIPPGKGEMKKPLTAMINRVMKSDITLKLGLRATVEDIASETPDQVLLATGALPEIPAIEGLQNAVNSDDVLSGKVKVSGRVLVIGAGMVGLETAEFLVVAGSDVTVVEILEEAARGVELITGKMMLRSLSTKGVKILVSTKIERFEGGKAFINGATGEELLGEFDAIVSATGSSPARELENKLLGRGLKVQIIGDAQQPGNIWAAVNAGYAWGCQL